MDISLYLIFFERQKEKKILEKEDLVKNVLSLLPMDITMIIRHEWNSIRLVTNTLNNCYLSI